MSDQFASLLMDVMVGDTRKIVDYDVQRDEYRVRADLGGFTSSVPVRNREDIDRAFAQCRKAILKAMRSDLTVKI